MKRRTMLWQALKKLDKEAYLDAAGKVLLGYRVICAFILKACIPELADYSIEYIENECIVDDPVIAEIHVHRNTCDENVSYEDDEKNDVTVESMEVSEMIQLLSTEDSTVDEGAVTYDVRFNAYIPKNGEKVKVIINLEAQNDFYPGYPLVSRGIYYDARMISAQYGVEFEKSDYGNIKKVYSIWICINPAKKFVNTINRYHYTEENILGNAKLPVSDYDKADVILVGLHTNGDEGKCGNEMIDMLSVVFDKNKEAKKKQDELEYEYGIKMTREYSEVVDNMCNISKYYTQDRDEARKNLDEAVKNLDEAVKDRDEAVKKAEDQRRKYAENLRKRGMSEEEIAEILN